MSGETELLGVWQAISAVISGQELGASEVGDIQLTLTETQFTTRRGTETLFDSTYTVDASKMPRQIQMVGIEEFAGQPALGIYAIQEETLRLCYKMPGAARATEFTSPEGSGAFLIILKRVR